MDLAKPGAIKAHCDPNAVATFQEYLDRFGSDETRKIGRRCIENNLKAMAPTVRSIAQKLLDRLADGETDVFC
jgi:2-iminoacetate synthase